MSIEEQDEQKHWRRNLTIGIGGISAVIIFSFAYYIPEYMHAEECKAMLEDLKSRSVIDQVLNLETYHEYDVFKQKCSDLYGTTN